MIVGAIIQARMDSSRFPGKVLMKLPYKDGDTILCHIVNRLKSCQNFDKIIIATSEEEVDYPIVEEAKFLGVEYYCGSKNDVLERFVGAAEKFNLDVVIRITGDNPIVFADVLDSVICKHLKSNSVYTRNINLPYGASFEIVNTKTLKQIQSEIPKGDPDREHVTIYIKKHNSKFNVNEIYHKLDNSLKNIRLTVDYPSDYAMLNILIKHLVELDFEYNIKDIEKFFQKNTWVKQINDQNIQKKTFDTLEEERTEAINLMENLGFNRIANEIKVNNE